VRSGIAHAWIIDLLPCKSMAARDRTQNKLRVFLRKRKRIHGVAWSNVMLSVSASRKQQRAAGKSPEKLAFP
jgi:hypothetical protein